MVTMVTMVTMVEPFCCVEHHIDSIRIDWIESVWREFFGLGFLCGLLFLYYAKDF